MGFGCEDFLCVEIDASVSADPSSTLGNKEKRRHLNDVSGYNIIVLPVLLFDFAIPLGLSDRSAV